MHMGVSTVVLVLNTDRDKGPSSCSDRFTPGKCLRYELNRRLGGPWSRNGHFGEKLSLAPAATQTLDRPARSLVTILTTLPRGLSGYRARRRVADSRGPVLVAGQSLNK